MVILGGRKPWEVDLTSSMADGFGALLSELTATWAKIAELQNRISDNEARMFFMAIYLIVNTLTNAGPLKYFANALIFNPLQCNEFIVVFNMNTMLGCKKSRNFTTNLFYLLITL
jgi:hypothetical protein